MKATHHHQEVTCPQDIYRDEALTEHVCDSDESGWTLWGDLSTRVVPVGPHRIWTPVALISSPALSVILGRKVAA